MRFSVKSLSKSIHYDSKISWKFYSQLSENTMSLWESQEFFAFFHAIYGISAQISPSAHYCQNLYFLTVILRKITWKSLTNHWKQCSFPQRKDSKSWLFCAFGGFLGGKFGRNEIITAWWRLFQSEKPPSHALCGAQHFWYTSSMKAEINPRGNSNCLLFPGKL